MSQDPAKMDSQSEGILLVCTLPFKVQNDWLSILRLSSQGSRWRCLCRREGDGMSLSSVLVRRATREQVENALQNVIIGASVRLTRVCSRNRAFKGEIACDMLDADSQVLNEKCVAQNDVVVMILLLLADQNNRCESRGCAMS